MGWRCSFHMNVYLLQYLQEMSSHCHRVTVATEKERAASLVLWVMVVDLPIH